MNSYKLDLLTSLYIFCIAVSELMGGKTFALWHHGSFHLNASVALFVVPIIYCVNDTVTEVYGKARARSIVRSGLMVVALILLFSLLAVHLPPSSRFLASEPAYDKIFSQSARISFASLVAFATAEFLDVFLFSRLRQRLGASKLWLRVNLSNFLSQFVDTGLFMFLAFYAFGKPLGDNVSFLFSLILPYWLLKSLMSVFETPFVYLAAAWLRRDKPAEA